MKNSHFATRVVRTFMGPIKISSQQKHIGLVFAEKSYKIFLRQTAYECFGQEVESNYPVLSCESNLDVSDTHLEATAYAQSISYFAVLKCCTCLICICASSIVICTSSDCTRASYIVIIQMLCNALLSHYARCNSQFLALFSAVMLEYSDANVLTCCDAIDKIFQCQVKHVCPNSIGAMRK